MSALLLRQSLSAAPDPRGAVDEDRAMTLEVRIDEEEEDAEKAEEEELRDPLQLSAGIQR